MLSNSPGRMWGVAITRSKPRAWSRREQLRAFLRRASTVVDAGHEMAMEVHEAAHGSGEPIPFPARLEPARWTAEDSGAARGGAGQRPEPWLPPCPQSKTSMPSMVRRRTSMRRAHHVEPRGDGVVGGEAPVDQGRERRQLFAGRKRAGSGHEHAGRVRHRHGFEVAIAAHGVEHLIKGRERVLAGGPAAVGAAVSARVRSQPDLHRVPRLAEAAPMGQLPGAPRGC